MTLFFAQTAWLVPLYPLVASLLSLLWSPGLISRTGPRPCGYLNLTLVSVAFVHSAAALMALHSNSAAGAAALYKPLTFGWTWLETAGLKVGFDGLITEPALIAMTVITGLHVLVQIYAIGYLEMDWGWPRFFGSLSFFEAGLCALVLTDSLFFSYVILELLTLGTYLIVGTWYNQPLVVKGARDAFLTKRIGDLILLAGLIALLPITGTWNFHGLQAWAADQVNNGNPLPQVLPLILLALIAGPMGKCAQIPLHLWLNEAMESPLPSTVLRNSVVVVGGAWVLLRLEPLIELSPLVQTVLVIVGGTTALVASLIALAQIDVKRALSFLVSSWLGLLFVAVGLGGISVADHLMLVYPLPMALMLMVIGAIVITNVTQDLTQLGGLWSKRPLMGLAFLTGAAGLMALPPFGGFAALRELLSLTAESSHPVLLGCLVLFTNALISAGLIRVFGLIFGGRPSVFTTRSAEVLWLMALPTFVLMGLVLHLPQLLVINGVFALSPLPGWGPLAVPLLISTLVGGGLSAAFYLRPHPLAHLPAALGGLQDWLAHDMQTERFYHRTVVWLVVALAQLSAWSDDRLIDGFSGASGSAALEGARRLSFTTSGRSQAYALTLVLGVLLMAAWLLASAPSVPSELVRPFR
ncbi:MULTISPECIES: NAD(P)H-quinone oxidoreductase subunit F [unclassified Cyanobium]|uniref:NAD(P)H-quinone oxidoreductase subunit F n=1 Tax=unclassified Cyanobium TaxID=2627006 RepID=UPI0020CBABAD|nr:MULTISPECIES: NAD(P)H-quinone oxidoreductase subunit F [unclassified Cyanobium]MCP9834517.1 NAD(P)H-quinone oxidoreductase subunit F [Cyanobium sp. La Preciosa 7G6]MCP9937280.1 NAD(P)H-quinone oxidoreductase subunit F [Cyanobium sp. Aljojuca 7A6]